MKLHILEIIPVVIYLISILLLGFFTKKKTDSEEDFILGGRQLTLPAFVATLVTTWYGGILGVGEFTYLYGLSNWIVFGLPYYIFALLFTFILAEKIRASSFLSIPDQFYRNFGNAGGYMGAVYTFFMTLPAPYILMVGLLLHLISGWGLWLCIILGSVFSMVYVLTGGFRSVVRTDKLQFILMFGGFAILFLVLATRFGGLSFLKQNLPPLHLTWQGGNSPEYILVWFFIASWTFIDPGFHQRCYAAKSSRVARNGILASVGFWFIFDFLTTSTGLYARALLVSQHIEPPLSFPLLGHEFLPPLLSGLFLTGLLATIMSTVDSFSLLSAITIGYDLVGKFAPKPKSSTSYLKIGLVITAMVSILLAVLVPSVVNIWLLLGNIFIPPMLLPLLACYYPKLNPGKNLVILNLTLAFLVALTFLLLSIAQSSSLKELTFFRGIPPMYPGLLTSILLFSAGIIKKRFQNEKQQK
jgi:SSS family solute:Na+ symporter